MSNQESIQLLQMNSGPLQNCLDASMTTLISKKICHCMAHFSPHFYSETDLWHHIKVWRERNNFCTGYLIFLQLVYVWPCQTTMSNVKTVRWLCQAKYAMPVYYFIVQKNIPRQRPECPWNQIKGQKITLSKNMSKIRLSWCLIGCVWAWVCHKLLEQFIFKDYSI